MAIGEGIVSSRFPLPQKNVRVPASHRTALAPLQRFDPAAILNSDGDDAVGQFVLMLALVFNDLKGLLHFQTLHGNQQPDNQEEVTPRNGEWMGIQIQIYRLIVAHLHEFLYMLEKQREIAESPAIQALIAQAAPSTRKRWRNLLEISTGHGNVDDRAVSKVVVKTRSNVTYHYHQPKNLTAGFKKFFFEYKKNPRNEAAMASLGDCMEATRFFFADAAVQTAIEGYAVEELAPGRFSNAFRKKVEAVNHTLAYIVSTYLATHGDARRNRKGRVS